MTDDTDRIHLKHADEVDPEALYGFLERVYGPGKATFLRQHGTWWHGGDQNRLVIVIDDQVAACCGVIPTRVHLDGDVRDALWWMDLHVAPEYRGVGVQRLFDKVVRGRSDVLLGFPNKLAADIHQRHGWGVRDDLRTMVAPLDPRRIAVIRRSRGFRALILRPSGVILAPAFAFHRRVLRRRPRLSARHLDDIDPGLLAVVARGAPDAGNVVTTCRDEAHFEHRYAQSPDRDSLRVYVASRLQPSVACIARRVVRDGFVQIRVLDLFGDLTGTAARDVLRLVVADAARFDAIQVTALASDPAIEATYRQNGFTLSATARSCWSSPDAAIMETLGRSRHVWCLGDSDNDEPSSEPARTTVP